MILEVDQLSAGYGRIPILNDVTFSVAAGEFVGVLGHNGMGKTTLMRALMGYLPATGGRVTFEGADVTRAAPHVRARAGFGYVPQGREIFPGLSVRENLRMGALKAGGDEGAAIEAALARCLAGAPKLILLDEPTEGIQPSIIEEIAETLARLRDKGGLTMILVEQNLEFISGLSQRVLILQKGAIVRQAKPEELHDVGLIHEFIGVED